MSPEGVKHQSCGKPKNESEKGKISALIRNHSTYVAVVFYWVTERINIVVGRAYDCKQKDLSEA
jgi:hypothetical protein